MNLPEPELGLEVPEFRDFEGSPMLSRGCLTFLFVCKFLVVYLAASPSESKLIGVKLSFSDAKRRDSAKSSPWELLADAECLRLFCLRCLGSVLVEQAFPIPINKRLEIVNF